MRALRGHGKLFALAVCLVVLGLGSGASRAEFVQSGKLLVSFDAAISPTKLPRDHLVPIKAAFAGSFERLDATDTPPLQTMQIRLSRGGSIVSQGLPRCSEANLRERSSSEALAACRRALVGEGTVRSALRFPDGRRQRSTSKLLLFNASNKIIMHIYAAKPLRGTFLVPMTIRRGSGGFATVLDARFPPIAAGYGYLTGFQMVIERTYSYRGERRSYLLASCPAPQGFPKVSFELARVAYDFGDGTVIRTAAIRSCRVR
ncbi:MAG TPA: hypothetical protein VD761_10235 [Solirubrobacterales bacterium]|nr:hypothetical protein [Solirubrobacterales bacterium]